MAKRIKTLSQFLQRHPVVSRIAVKWGDMDAFQHVNNTVYFKYQEVSRLHFFKHIMDGMQRSKFNGFLKGAGLGPIVSDTYVKFIYPLEFPDKILVGATIPEGELGKDRYKLCHSMWSLKHQRIVAEGYATVVSYNYDTKKVEDMNEEMVGVIRNILQKDALHMLEDMSRVDIHND